MNKNDSERPDPGTAGGGAAGGMDNVLASIRALVTAETSVRLGESGNVLMLTPDMRHDAEGDGEDASRAGDILAEGIGEDLPAPAPSAPILDEEAIRILVNRIVREELQGELGERIGRNLRKLIRREIAQLEEERRGGA